MRLLPVLTCAALATAACAELPSDDDEAEQTAQDADEALSEESDVLAQTIPGFPWGPVGGTDKKSDAGTPKPPTIPGWPGGWGPVGGVGSSGKSGSKPPRPPSIPWPGGFGGVGAGASE